MSKTSMKFTSVMLAIMMIISILTTTAFANEDGTVSSDGVSYLVPTYVGGDASNGVDDWETKSVTTYTSVATDSTSWSAGWYVVDSTVTISTRITVTGDVHLILVDGCTLTASAGITVEGTDSLTIYAQSTGDSMGKLVATATASPSDLYCSTDAGIGGTAGDGDTAGNSAGTITINGGNITATGGTATNADSASGTATSAMISYDAANSNGWYNDDIVITATDGYSIATSVSDTFASSITITTKTDDGSQTYYVEDSDGLIYQGTFTYKLDAIAPTATILIGGNTFTDLLRSISFNMFFKESIDVTISGTDDSSGVDTIYYQLVEDAGDFLDSDSSWTAYDDSFTIDANSQVIVYAKIVDEAGNVTIINSNGVTVYTDSEQDTDSFDFIKGSDGDQTVSVTLNGNSISSVIYGDRTVSSENYTIDDNEITFTADYLETFERGSYTFYISYNPMDTAYDSSVDGNQSPDKTTVTVNIYELAVVTMDGVAIENVLIGDTLTLPEDPTKAGYIFTGWMLDGALYDFDTVITQDIVLVSTWEAVEEQQIETTGTADVMIDNDTQQQLLDELFSAEEIALNVEMKATVNVDIVAVGDLDADTQARFDAYLSDYSADLGDDTTATQAMVFDISIIKSLDGVEETVTNLTTPITITIAIPEEFQNDDRTFFILRDHDGTITYLADEDDDPTTVTFTTDCFSNYTLNYTETVVDTDSDADVDVDVNADVDTGDHGTALPIALSVAAMVGMAVLMKKKALVK